MTVAADRGGATALGSAMNRRAVLAGATALAGCSAFNGGGGREGRALTVTSYGGAYEKVLRTTVVPAFEATHPYRVNLIVTDDVSIVPRLVLAQGLSPFDVITINDDTAIALRDKGLLSGDYSAKLTELPHIYPLLRPPHAVVYASTIYQFELVHRIGAFRGPPSSWRDLWRPGITVGVPYIGLSYGIIFLYIAALLNGGDADNMDPGFEAIKRIPRFKIYNNVGHGLQLFQQGEIDAAFYYAHRAQQMIAMGFPIARCRPREGIFGQFTGTQIPRGARNVEGALAWINFSLSTAYQQPLTTELYSPANMSVAIPRKTSAGFVTGDQAVANLKFPPWDRLLPQRDALLDKWRREIG